MVRRTRTTLGSLALLALGALTSHSSAASPIPPSPDQWVVDADGTDPTKLGTGAYDAAWSPDGSRLAFEGPDAGLVVANLATGEQRRVSPTDEFVETLAWSPNGTTIAYVATRGGFDFAIRAVESDGSNWRTLFEVDGVISGLDWSPDGSRIAFAYVERDGPAMTLTILDAATGSVTPVETTSVSGGQVDWSPDGAWIAYTESSGSTSRPFTGIRVVRPDGRDDRRISEGLQYAYDFDWAPDSTTLAFYGLPQKASSHPGPGIYVSSPVAPSPSLVIPDAHHPDWSPDGSRIAYSSSGDLFTRARDGSDPRQVTSEELRDDYAPLWSPDGTRIAFTGTRVQVFCGGFPYPYEASIVGTSDADVLKGTEEPDVIAGRGGDDEIVGLGGGDIVCGGDGHDEISGGDGNDSVFGDDGNDVLVTDAGDDRVEGGRGDDVISAGMGHDWLGFTHDDAGVTVNLVLGESSGDGRDVFDGIENVTGSSGPDTIVGDKGPNLLYGASLRADAGADAIYGGRGADELRGMAGRDRLRGGRGRDDLKGGAGRDHCLGGERYVGCENQRL